MAEQTLPPEAAIDFLRSNPNLSAKFDEKYGVGTAATYLPPSSDAMPAPAAETVQEPVQAGTEVQVNMQRPEEGGLIVETESAPIWDTVDVVKAVPGGAVASFENQGDLVTQFVEYAGGGKIPLGFTFDDEIMERMRASGIDAAGIGEVIYDSQYLDDPVFGKVGTPDAMLGSRESIAGGMVQGVSQFVTGFVTMGKLLAPLKAGAGVSTGGKMLSVTTQSAGSGFISFDPQEPRLSDFIQTFPTLANPVADYLASDPADGEVEGRFKSALEEVFVGMALEPVFKIVKALRDTRRLRAEGKIAEAEKLYNELAEELDESLNVTKEAPQAELPLKPKAEPAAPKIEPVEEVIEGFRPTDIGQINRGLDLAKMTADDFEPDASNWLNWNKYDSPDDYKAMLQALSEGEAKQLVERISAEGVQSQDIVVEEGVKWLSETMGMGLENTMAALGKQAGSLKELPQTVVASKMMVQSLLADIKHLASNVDHGIGGTKEILELGRRMDMLEDMTAYLKGISRQTARALAAHRKMVGPGADIQEVMADLAKRGGPDSIRIRARRIAMANSAGGVRKLAAKSGVHKAMDVFNEFYINSILSGTKTQFVNLASNTAQTFLMPMEKMIGGALMGDKTLVNEGYRYFLNTFAQAKESAKMSAIAMRTGNNVLDPHISKYDAPMHAIDSDAEGLLGSLIRGTGSFVRFPMRMLMTGDEFFSQVNFRADLMSKLQVESSMRFPKNSKMRAAFIQSEWEKAFTGKSEVAWGDVFGRDKGQFSDLGAANTRRSAADPSLASPRAEESLAVARETIFTTDLKDVPSHFPKSPGAAIQEAVNAVPIFRPFLPFIRTPANIIRTWALHTPGLNVLYKKTWDDYAAGGEVRAKVLGKMATGTAFYAGAYQLAVSGQTTGRGPTDKFERERLREAGWQPYSWVTTAEDGTKTYIQYNRFDPVGMFFGMVSDVHYASSHASEADASVMSGAVLSAVMGNMENKAYFKGISDLLEAFGESDRRGEAYLRKFLGGLVPTIVPEIGRATGLMDDDIPEQVRILDGIMAKLPYWSDQLPTKRSWLTGNTMKYEDTVMYPDTVSPFVLSHSNPDPVVQMLAEVEHGFQPPAGVFGNVNIKNDMPEAYDRLLQLTARPFKGGSSLRDALGRAMARKNFNVEQEKVLLASGSPGSILKPIIEHYRTQGRNALLREFPDLRKAETQWMRTESKARTGDAEALKALEQFDQNK